MSTSKPSSTLQPAAKRLDPPSKPFFIVLDGIDGCGKGEQIKRLKTYLEDRGNRKPVEVHDPGTTPAAVAIRKLLLNKGLGMVPEVQTLLYTAARRSLKHHIARLRTMGHDVLCNRWWLSTLAYQGYTGKVGPFMVTELQKDWVGYEPDIHIVLDLPAEVAAERTGKRSDPGGKENLKPLPMHDRFEARGHEYMEEVRQSFLLAAEDHYLAWVVDGNQPPDVVFEAVLEAISFKCRPFANFSGRHYGASCKE